VAQRSVSSRSAVFKGDGVGLAIEFRDGASVPVKVTTGQVDWDELSDRIHRAVNIAYGQNIQMR
jgi:hypothetical protein